MDAASARCCAAATHPRVVVNRNALVQRVPWVNGVKTGHTFAAGYILVASGTRGGTTFVASVLGDPSEAARDADALALLRWAFASFRVVSTARARCGLRAPAVAASPAGTWTSSRRATVRALLRRDVRVRIDVNVPRKLHGPLPRRADRRQRDAARERPRRSRACRSSRRAAVPAARAARAGRADARRPG